MVFSFGRKAKFQKLLDELLVAVRAQSTSFAAAAVDEIEDFAATGLFSFSTNPRVFTRLFFKIGGPPKSDKTHANQFILFMMGFSFFSHAIERDIRSRPNNEALRTAILEPIVFTIAKGLAPMLKRTPEEALRGLRSFSFRYDAWPQRQLLGTNERDKHCALWVATEAIVVDGIGSGLPLIEAEKPVLEMIVRNELVKGLQELELPKRIEALVALL
jgi:hypothetical protein